MATIPDGDTSCTFLYLPSQACILLAEKTGSFPYETVAGVPNGARIWSAAVLLYPLPSPTFRIDSIQFFPDTAAQRMNYRLVIPQPVPTGGYLRATVFLSLTKDVGPTPGSYFMASDLYLSGGNSFSGYYIPRNFDVPLGTRIYATARLWTGVTRVFVGSAFDRTYTNLETNTNVVSSFVLQ